MYWFFVGVCSITLCVEDFLILIKEFASPKDLGGFMVGVSANICTAIDKNWGRRPMVLGVLVIWMSHTSCPDFYDRL